MSVVAITGVSGYLGQSLLSQLDLDEEVEAIIGVDRDLLSCPPPDKLTFVQHDLTKPLGALFADHGVTHAIHVATVGVREHEADPSLDLTIVGNVLDACGAAGARSVCVASSVIVYGAHPDNTILLEGSIVRPNPELPAAATKLALEERCYDFVKAFPETALQIVRPCPILGPTARGLFTRILDAPRIYGPWRVDPRFQFVHEDDATRAIHRLVKSESFGVFNLAGDGSLTLSQIAQLAERRLVRLPGFLLRFAAWLGWKLGKTDLHPGLLPFLLYPWLIAAVKVRNSAYFVPRYDSADALLGYLEHRGQREPEPLKPFHWAAPAPTAKPAPASEFGQRPGLDAEDRAQTKPLGRPERLEDHSDLEELSRANDTPDPDSADLGSSPEDEDASPPTREGPEESREGAPDTPEGEARGESGEPAPEAAEPEPDPPEATESEPDQPQPDLPKAAEPEPDQPEPDLPEATESEPDQPQPDLPKAAEPEPDPPEATESEPDQPQPDLPKAAEPEPDPPEATESEPEQPQPDLPKAAEPEPDQPEPAADVAAGEPAPDDPAAEASEAPSTQGEEEANLDASEPAREESA